jgi:hypothetical protein
MSMDECPILSLNALKLALPSVTVSEEERFLANSYLAESYLPKPKEALCLSHTRLRKKAIDSDSDSSHSVMSNRATPKRKCAKASYKDLFNDSFNSPDEESKRKSERSKKPVKYEHHLSDKV